MPTVLTVKPSEVQFSSPKIVMGQNFTCHYQYASLRNEPLYLQTSSFFSKGPRKSRYSDHLQLLLPKTCTSTLLSIDEKAKQSLKCPNDATKQLRKNFESKDGYKQLQSDKVYLKFANDWKCFNEKGEVIHCDLSSGTYTLVLHIIGIFIGHHGSTSNVASLQVRIKQVKFEAKPQMESLFIKPTLTNRRGVAVPKLDIDNIPTVVSDDSEGKPKKKKAKVEKKVSLPHTPIYSDTDGDDDDDDDEDDDDRKDFLVRSKRAKRLLQAFRLNNYPTQQETKEEQIVHDDYLASLDVELCNLLGNDWKVNYL